MEQDDEVLIADKKELEDWLYAQFVVRGTVASEDFIKKIVAHIYEKGYDRAYADWR